MKILSAQQIREADKYTIEHEPISSLDLMERAANACFRWIITRFPKKENKILVFAGNGNNGGDGLAIARLLHNAGYIVKIVLCTVAPENSRDFESQLQRINQENIETENWESFNTPHSIPQLLIDALLGTGLNRSVKGEVAQLITQINSYKTTVVSVDVPSGLFADDNSNNDGEIVRASITLTFQCPKYSFFFSENHLYIGSCYVLDIALHPDFFKKAETNKYFIVPDLIKNFLLNRTLFQHKGNFGHACIIAGSKGKIGAGILATKACISSGAALTTSVIPEAGNIILQSAVPEAMCITSGNEYIETIPTQVYEYSAIGVGPGIGNNTETQQMLKLIIQQYKGPLLLDADAINILSENKTWISFLPENTILTPHPKEFERLTGKSNSAYERHLKQIDFSVKYRVIVVLKGAYTSVSLPNGNVYFNSTGNAGMAKGGSGDVLTGLITGLMARGYMPQQAALLGVYIHGLAGDYAAKEYQTESMTAENIITCFSKAFSEVYSEY